MRCRAASSWTRAGGSSVRVLLAALQLLLIATAAAWAQNASLEWPIKATYLYKIASFVDWPPEALGPPDAPVPLCIVGDDPFGELLDRAVADARVAQHPLVVRRLPTVGRGSGCRILYAAGSRAQPAAAILAAVQGEPVLTVTDAALGGTGGIVHFLVLDNRVRFDIDAVATAENRLAISSKLLSLAVNIRSKP
jgi:hypothetical protein